MKKQLIYTVLFTLLMVVGCSKDFLDPERDTSNLTTDLIAENIDANPDLNIGFINGLTDFMIKPFGVLPGRRHYDFGQKGVDIFLDILSSDMALSQSSYGWYNSTANLNVTVDYTREENMLIWTYYYKLIKSANSVVQTSGGNSADPQDPQARRILGQAKTARAFSYYYLAQLFQREYNPSQKILPYYDGEEFILEKVEASKIYELIINDLTHAVELLDGYVRENKSQINQTIAQGYLAYAYAAMGNYEEAKTMADAVIASGHPLTTTDQLAFPGEGSGFNDVNTASWIWGFDLTEDLGHQLIDWWGQMDYFTYSYAAAGDTKSIDQRLYDDIPDNDIRKTQFGDGAAPLQPVNKFFDPNREPAGQYVITTDLIFLRVDEFYLLSAEAAAKTGDEAAAKATLIDLLTSRLGGAANAEAYVNPLSGQALIDAIYLQTRIELWGEGRSYFAMKRNQATVTRGSNHLFRAGESFVYNTDEMSFQIPQEEIINNPYINEQN